MKLSVFLLTSLLLVPAAALQAEPATAAVASPAAPTATTCPVF